MGKLIKERSLSELAYEDLFKRILAMKAGDNKLPSEEELSREMGVSRTTIREAFKKLAKEGYITAIHGKGTFAHPSVSKAKNRIDIYSDFYVMLSKHYEQVEVETKWMGLQPAGEEFSHLFEGRGQSFQSDWIYKGNGNIMLYCSYEFLPDYIITPIEETADYTSLSDLGPYLKSPIDSCLMKLIIKSDKKVLDTFGLPSCVPLICCDEKIYDINDNLVAIGYVYIHPSNMALHIGVNFDVRS